MSEKELQKTLKIKNYYTEKPISKLEQLKLLDTRVKAPALIFAYVFGVIGTLILGVGMSLAMNLPELIAVFGDTLIIGIIIGLVGIICVSINYPIFKKLLASRKSRYSEQVIKLSDEILQSK